MQRLAQKFGLKESDVQAVFDDARKERQATMQAKFEEQLSQAVKDGKLTEAQKEAILKKHQELQAKHLEKSENLQNMTAEQRREMMQTQKAELESWAKENGIDLKYLHGFVGLHPEGVIRSHLWNA